MTDEHAREIDIKRAHEIRMNLRNEATAARARGDSEAERAALDRLVAFEERAGLS